MTASGFASTPRRVFYLGRDLVLRAALSSALESADMRLQSFDDLETLLSELERQTPFVIVLDLLVVPREIAAVTLIEGWSRRSRRSPRVICIAHDEAIETRLELMRAGAKGYFTVPVTVSALIERVIKLVDADTGEQPRILVVEDDPVQARYAAMLLEKAGMEVEVLDQPLRVIETMQAFQPDLVLMDLYMPEASGAELTAIIRDHDRFFDVPIIFLSAETDPEKQMDALRVGGDSFFVKPIQREQLIAAIEHRIRLSRWLRERHDRALVHSDDQGLLAKPVFMRQLDQLVHAQGFWSAGTLLLLLELDAPEQALDALGIRGMEGLISRLEARLIRQLEPGESGTRLDDFSFALLLRRATLPEAEAMAESVRELIASTRPQGESRRVRLSASIGLGLLTPRADDAITLVSRAQTALARAKQSGGNRVLVWSPVIQTAGADHDRVLEELVAQAVAGDGLVLLYQPIVSLSASVGELFEVQLRLRTPEGEFIPAGDFLPVALRVGLMPRMDRWVLEQALAAMAQHRETYRRLRLLIHQSVDSVLDPDWLPWFRERILEHDLIKRRPMLQFQMRDLRARQEAAKGLVEMLRKYGIQVAIANVSGHSEDLALLADLSVALAKLSFATVKNSDQDELARIVQRLQALRIAVIAAGIEDDHSLARVWNARPDFIQGNSLQMPSLELRYDFHGSSDEL